MTTRKDVADRAGVSEATVSRVLNGVGPIREATRQRVLEAAKALNYHLNAVASSFARGKSGNLGVVLPHVPKVHLFSTYYFSEILSGIGEAVRDSGYGLLLLFRDPGEPFDYVSLYRSLRVDACIVLGASSIDAKSADFRALAAEGLPCCVLDQDMADVPMSTVAADHVQGSYAAVSHLVRIGYRRIGFLNGSPQYSNSRDRLEGYRAALADGGIAYDPRLVYRGNYSRTSGYAAAKAVYADLDRLDALFVSNDRMAIGIMQGLRERGCSLPADLAIAGYDDSDAARLMDTPLTTVQVPFYEMGRLAAQRLLERLPVWNGAESLFHEKLGTTLIVRKSCGT